MSSGFCKRIALFMLLWRRRNLLIEVTIHPGKDRLVFAYGRDAPQHGADSYQFGRAEEYPGAGADAFVEIAGEGGKNLRNPKIKAFWKIAGSR